MTEPAGRSAPEVAGPGIHDDLSQQITAVAIKNELAAAMLKRRPAEVSQARHHVEEAAAIARQVLSSILAVPPPRAAVRLDRELAGAQTLLTAAGVAFTATTTDVPLGTEVEELLAQAVREGVTYVLRHGAATRCRIVSRSGTNRVDLRLTSDGAAGMASDTVAWERLAARCRELGGESTAELHGDAFSLSLQLPTTGSRAAEA